ncbi:hypothetical protein [Streptomyces sp. NPDC001404]|uniref:hypothetical protein n=1 Tax=Streptomyces sp. NPDC001404 TaxID=3364571 RepID=UPI0036912D77
MTTRSLSAVGAIKSIEQTTKSFTFQHEFEEQQFTLQIPDGAMLLGGWHSLILDGKEAKYDLSSGPTMDGRGWCLRIPRNWEYSETSEYKAQLTVSVSYALPA